MRGSSRSSASGGRPTGRRRSRAFTLIELLMVISIVAVLASVLVAVGRRANESAKMARARGELAGLVAALENYRRQFGEYPRTSHGTELLRSLLGKRGPAGAPLDGRPLIELAPFQIAGDVDPLVGPGAELVDPWLMPYRYAFKTETPWKAPAYVLFSSGPDGRATPLLAGGRVDERAAENVDNLYASP